MQREWTHQMRGTHLSLSLRDIFAFFKSILPPQNYFYFLILHWSVSSNRWSFEEGSLAGKRREVGRISDWVRKSQHHLIPALFLLKAITECLVPAQPLWCSFSWFLSFFILALLSFRSSLSFTQTIAIVSYQSHYLISFFLIHYLHCHQVNLCLAQLLSFH